MVMMIFLIMYAVRFSCKGVSIAEQNR
jgi:hypothetical protein